MLESACRLPSNLWKTQNFRNSGLIVRYAPSACSEGRPINASIRARDWPLLPLEATAFFCVRSQSVLDGAQSGIGSRPVPIIALTMPQ
jgi:hypothetical protein